MTSTGVRAALGRRSALVIGAVVALVVLVLAGGWYLTREPHDYRVDGPHGSFPAALGSGAPVPSRTVATASRTVELAGGLALLPGKATLSFPEGKQSVRGTSRGITAVSLRDHRAYWTYTRPGRAVIDIAATDGDVFALWNDGQLTRIDSRSGKPRWRHHLDQPLVKEGRQHAQLIAPQHGLVLLVASDRVDAFAADSGAARWTGRPADGCPFALDQNPVFTGTTVVIASRNDRCTVAAYRLDNGGRAWTGPSGVAEVAAHPVAVDDTTVLLTGRQGGTLVAAADGRPVRQLTTPVELWDASGGLVVGAGQPEDSGRDALGVWDASTGRRLWQNPVPTGFRLDGGPLLAGGQVYVTLTPEDGKAKPSLVVLDARTGARKASLDPPIVVPAGLSGDDAASFRDEVQTQVLTIGEGVLAVLEGDEAAFQDEAKGSVALIA
ncbi:outer membrane protein assembly factor BamB family protein [Actinomadura rupiterrae]|uniref:outer membrane protein assembly factor BamB family protein n=1 Tax=Actinomadura rupiterrae TaxID=559627 RepID=UPI0020A500C1|nr:PQQ-binding-like beta-propeller repeat protein [Actinomadura rupiterrae]MCP2337208.1 outer membrane protein assembly factor BamB [Actinomadura rupiterrae]